MNSTPFGATSGHDGTRLESLRSQGTSELVGRFGNLSTGPCSPPASMTATASRLRAADRTEAHVRCRMSGSGRRHADVRGAEVFCPVTRAYAPEVGTVRIWQNPADSSSMDNSLPVRCLPGLCASHCRVPQGGDERTVAGFVPQHFVYPHASAIGQPAKGFAKHIQARYVVESVQEVADEHAITCRNIPGALQGVQSMKPYAPAIKTACRDEIVGALQSTWGGP